MKTCPKCGTNNKSDNPACFKCYASLEGVPSNGMPDFPPTINLPPAGARPKPAPSARPAGAEPTVVAGSAPVYPGSGQQPAVKDAPPGQNGQPYQPYPPPRPYGPRTEFPRNAAPKKSSAGLIVALLSALIVLGAGGFFAWKYMSSRTPVGVARLFLAAKYKGNVIIQKKYATKGSWAKIDADAAGGLLPAGFGAIRGQSKPEFIEGKQYTLVQGSLDEKTAKVMMKLDIDKMEQMKAVSGMNTRGVDVMKMMKKMSFIKNGFPIVLVKEEGRWKVDVPQTESAIMAAIMQSIQEVSAKYGFPMGMPGMRAPQGMPGTPQMPPGMPR